MTICEICAAPGATNRPAVSEERDAHLCDECYEAELEAFPEVRERAEELSEQ